MNSQKRLLLTLKYLWEKTDEEHPATLKEIGEYLQHNGIETTRKTLQADINLLTGFGIDIICNHSTQNQYHTYDDQIVRQILQCVVVESKQKIKVVFIGGLEVECDVEQA